MHWNSLLCLFFKDQFTTITEDPLFYGFMSCQLSINGCRGRIRTEDGVNAALCVPHKIKIRFLQVYEMYKKEEAKPDTKVVKAREF